VFAQISGMRGSTGYLSDLGASDSVGDRWTHYWKQADLYSRIDYLLVSSGMVRETARERSGVYRSADWNKASDHRPIWAAILAAERR
jgi:endonuclease/exonuclease/phosphatase family metal-dependent hydrolase